MLKRVNYVTKILYEPDRSTGNRKEICEYCLIFLDLEKAYDRVLGKVLWWMLRRK